MPPIGEGIQTSANTVGDGSISRPISAPDCDFYPIEGLDNPNEIRIPRKSNAEYLENGSKKPRLDHTKSTKGLHSENESTGTTSPRFMLPSQEKEGQCEVPMALDRISTRTNSTTIDSTSRQDTLIESFERPIDVGRNQLLPRTGRMFAPPRPSMVPSRPQTSAAGPAALLPSSTNETSTIGHRRQSAEDVSVQDRPVTASSSFPMANQSQTNGEAGRFAVVFGVRPQEFQKCLEKVTARLDWVRKGPRHHLIEASRLVLMKQACIAGDAFFLVLHQLFCKKHIRADSESESRSIEEGFQAVGDLLAPNTQLHLEAIRWFSMCTLSSVKADQRDLEMAVLLFLGRFPSQWKEIRQANLRYSCPSLCGAIAEKTPGSDSVVLQQVMFRAILRPIWIHPHDECFEKCMALFIEDQQQVQAFLKVDRSEVALSRAILDVSAERAQKEICQILVSHLAHGVKSRTVVNVREMPHSRTPIMSQTEFGVPETPVDQNHQLQQAAPMHQASQMQQVPPIGHAYQLPPANSVQLGSQTQQSALRYQDLRVQGVPQTQETFQMQSPPQTSQSAQIQKNPVLQQNIFVQREPHTGWRTSSNRPLIPLASNMPAQKNYIQQMESVRNMLGSSPMTYSEPVSPQWSPGYSRQTNFLPLANESSTNRLAANVTMPSTQPNTATVNVLPNLRAGMDAPPYVVSADSIIQNSSANLPQIPNPRISSLHQAHAESPQLEFQNPDSQEKAKAFRYIKRVIFGQPLSNSMKSFQSIQEIDKQEFDKFPKDIIGRIGLRKRQVSNGSYLARVRCVKLKGSDALPSESDWVTSDMCWPPYIAVSVNKVFLEIRRKSHFGRDLAVDVTSMLKLGENKFKGAVLGLPDDCADHWLVGLEFVEVVDAPCIKKMLTVLTYPHCRDRIFNKLPSDDPDIEIIRSQTVLDVTDPFSSRLIDVPVRGRDCSHHQCFDLDTFLETRGNLIKNEPCLAEDFKCPICKGDVRPHMMVVDAYLLYLRKELTKKVRLDAKAVVLQEDGTWEIKEEDTRGEDGDGSGERLGSNSGSGGAL